MSITRQLIASVAIAVTTSAAIAQQAPQPSSGDAGAKPMSMHDHGSERGTPMGMSHVAQDANKPASGAKKAASGAKVPGHDHAKFHKNQ